MENALLVLVFVLLLMNAGQFIFWTREIQKLIDKNMSRNYADYVASKEYRPATSLKPTLSDAQEEQAIEENVLDELNRHFGMKSG